ncbi:hypothetical protein OF83DRAFT_1180633 [Amylostereum chailletii]|nr:hypothetical protein OF83DRAFT_1180633 [Amylostereum chailletii]
MQLAFNPVKPHVLYSSFRRHDVIYAWDLRGDTSVPVHLLQRRDGGRMETNQKIKFDVDIGGKWLGVGDESGNVHMFDVDEPTSEEEAQGTPVIRPTLSYRAHDDAVGSVAFHPLKPLVLSVSGSRHFDTEDVSRREDSSGSSDEDDAQDAGVRAVKRHRYRPQPSIRDSSVKLWEFGGRP